jgi:hypothetical protein
MRSSPYRLLALAAFALAACHHAPPAEPPAPPPPAAAAPALPPAPPGHLRRAEVDQVLLETGPAWIFRRLLLEEVLGRDARFVGWRLVGVPEEWRGIDLRPGDIISRINGQGVERPDNAWEIWKSVAKEPQIKVLLTRNGAAQEVVIPIDGAPSAETLKKLAGDTPAPRPTVSAPAQAPRRKASVQLGGAGEGAEEEAY